MASSGVVTSTTPLIPAYRIFTRGDTLVSLYAQLNKADGSIPVLGGEVKFYMKKRGAKVLDEPKVNGKLARIVDAAKRRVAFDWDHEDTDTTADYYAWFVNVVGGVFREHFPGQGRLLIVSFVEAEGILAYRTRLAIPVGVSVESVPVELAAA